MDGSTCSASTAATVLTRWTEIVRSSLTGRMSDTESSHDLREVLDSLLAGSGSTDVRPRRTTTSGRCWPS